MPTSENNLERRNWNWISFFFLSFMLLLPLPNPYEVVQLMNRKLYKNDIFRSFSSNSVKPIEGCSREVQRDWKPISCSPHWKKKKEELQFSTLPGEPSLTDGSKFSETPAGFYSFKLDRTPNQSSPKERGLIEQSMRSQERNYSILSRFLDGLSPCPSPFQ